jgi:hypothetical protein
MSVLLSNDLFSSSKQNIYKKDNNIIIISYLKKNGNTSPTETSQNFIDLQIRINK